MRLADGEKLHDQGFARFDRDGNLLIRTQPIEERRRRKDAHVRIGLAKFCVREENVWIEEITEKLVTPYVSPDLNLQAFLRLLHIGRLQPRFGASFVRLSPA